MAAAGSSQGLLGGGITGDTLLHVARFQTCDILQLTCSRFAKSSRQEPQHQRVSRAIVVTL